ncbi:MAG: hypothetical protein FWF87_05195 [Synergistaceae bacterium]|nr:hypothetical protein [Synergistaceae bacterium]
MTKEIEIEFSGEKEPLWDRIKDRAGCNYGVAMFALLVLFALAIRRKR